MSAHMSLYCLQCKLPDEDFLCKVFSISYSLYFLQIRVIPNASVSTSKSTLIIPPSKETAFFRCRASNEAGDGTRNVTVHWRG